MDVHPPCQAPSMSLQVSKVPRPSSMPGGPDAYRLSRANFVEQHGPHFARQMLKMMAFAIKKV